MRTILVIVRKEFLQIRRNRSMLPIIFVLPIVQLLILSNAATFELRNIRLGWQDRDHSSSSRLIEQKMRAAGSFTAVPIDSDARASLRSLEEDTADVVMEIPRGFEADLIREGKAEVQVLINAIDGAAAGVESAYTLQILQSATRELAAQNLGRPVINSGLELNSRFWYNPELDYQTYMVPGLLVLLVTMIALFLASMNIVREKEIGTIEQLNVTPIRKYEFVIGKLLPFWVIGLFELAFGLTIAKLFFAIPIVGSLWLIFCFAAVYLVAILGMGFFISTLSDTQQQAMFIAWFFMVIFILLSGLFTPIESMPDWAQKITWFNPIAYFVRVLRLVMLKGSTFVDVSDTFVVMVVAALTTNLAAIINYRKQN